MDFKCVVFLLIILINAKLVFNQETTPTTPAAVGPGGVTSTTPGTTTTTTTTTSTTTPGATTTTHAPTTTITSPTTTTTTSGTTRAPSCPLPYPGVYCKDCRTLQSCKATGQEPEWTIACSFQNSAKPYCDNSTCTSINTCEQTEVPLETCQKVGRRPDPLDCTQYVECVARDSGGYFGYTVKCPDGLRYNPTSQTCTSIAACITIKQMCVGKAGKLVAYRPYPSIFAKCPDANTNQQIKIDYCKQEYTFQEKLGNCQPECKQEGNIPCNENCHAYFLCVRNGFRYDMEKNFCPSNSGFNPITKLCDPKLAKCESVGTSLILDNRVSDLDGFFNSIFHFKK